MTQTERIAALEARVAVLERLHGPRCAADEPVLLALLEITEAGKFRTRDVRERLRIDTEFREIFNAAMLDPEGIGYPRCSMTPINAAPPVTNVDRDWIKALRQASALIASSPSGNYLYQLRWGKPHQ